MAKLDIGEILKQGRVRAGLSQGDVAEKLGLGSAQSVSDWERNYGSGVPVPTLKKLIKLYRLDVDQVFEALLQYQYQKLEQDLETRFYGRGSKKSAK